MKIVIASCCRLQHTEAQPVWGEIRAEQPDALLLLGDNIYLDCDTHDDPAALAAELRQRYAAQFAEAHFDALRRDMRSRGKPVLAIYDDHDFLGNNRCGADFAPALRSAAREALVAAFDPPRTRDEVYSSQRLGAVRVVMLDTRFHRLSVSAAAGLGDRDAVLGAEQWAWLQAELDKRDTPFLLIASSSTFHLFRSEAWELYPAAFSRLRALLRGRRGALFVSGDIHANALYDDSGVVEVVSSGVARCGKVFGVQRKGYGVLAFDAEGVQITLRSNKPGDRLHTRIALADWRLS